MPDLFNPAAPDIQSRPQIERVIYWITYYTEEIVPCDCSLEGWAKWLSGPDADWGRDSATQDGAIFSASGSTVTYHDVETVGDAVQYHPPLPLHWRAAATSVGYGGGWAGPAAYNQENLDEIARESGGPIACMRDHDHPYLITYRMIDGQPTCTAEVLSEAVAGVADELETEIRELFAAKMREFSQFCAEKWTMTVAEVEQLTTPVKNPAAYAEGYNAAMSDGIACALEFWLDEELGYS